MSPYVLSCVSSPKHFINVQPSDFLHLFNFRYVIGCINHDIVVVGICSELLMRLPYHTHLAHCNSKYLSYYIFLGMVKVFISHGIWTRVLANMNRLLFPSYKAFNNFGNRIIWLKTESRHTFPQQSPSRQSFYQQNVPRNDHFIDNFYSRKKVAFSQIIILSSTNPDNIFPTIF